MSLVKVAQYPDPPSAHIARALLEAHGIDAYLANEHYVAVQWLHAQAVGGVEVLVDREQAEQARALLEIPAEPPPFVEPKPVESETEETCPACGVASIAPDRLDHRVRALGLWLGVPTAIGRYRFRCTTCGHRWRAVPRHRGLRARLADLVAFALAALLAVPRILLSWVRRSLGLRERVLECWACGTPFAAGDERCHSCDVVHPPVLAFDRVIEAGKAYDAVCPRCKTPWLTSDYDGARASGWRCSFCKAPLSAP